MLNKEELIKALEKCTPQRSLSDKTEASCRNCPFGCSDQVTLVCREVLEAMLNYLKDEEEFSNGRTSL